MILDRYDDNDLFLRKVFANRGVPALVKAASDARNARNKNNEDYALVIKQGHKDIFKYPVFDAGNTVASAVYFGEYGQQLEEEHQKTAATNIKVALESFGFVVPEVLSKTASIELGYSNAAEEMSLEALFGFEPGEAEVVQDAFNKCSPRGKRRLMVQVKEASATPHEDREAYSSTVLGTDLEISLDARRLLVGDEAHEALDLIMIKSSSVTPEVLVSDVAQFDLDHQLVHHYGKFIPDPFESIYGRSISKHASPDTVEVGGEATTDTTLANMIEMSYSRIEDSFGSSFAEQLKSDPVPVFTSLPTPHKKALSTIFKG